mgnify:CR=1 FL=1|jgi:hypothetical protein|tara:strand:- start:42760 stop:42912 length:153 start_codon:yes stop_codon:yes gene_type:complete
MGLRFMIVKIVIRELLIKMEEKFKDILREDDKDFLMMYENIEDFLKEFKK